MQVEIVKGVVGTSQARVDRLIPIFLIWTFRLLVIGPLLLIKGDILWGKPKGFPLYGAEFP